MKVNVYKMEIVIFDFECYPENEVKNAVESNRYAHSRIIKSQCKEVEWRDDHPLNKTATSDKAIDDLFA